ncbi:MAG: T9SS C-terminal target domain-containing protein, partial [Bacteroidetes bacterium]
NDISNPDRFEYPVYNQAMGLYAMLKTPTKDVAKANAVELEIQAELRVPNTNDLGEPSGGTTVIQEESSTVGFHPREVFKLNHDLQYTLNPSAQINFNATNLEAAWMIEVENADKSDLWSFTSPNMFKTYSYQNSTGKTITVFSSEFLPIECISQFIPVFNIEVAHSAKNISYFDSHAHSGTSDFDLIEYLNDHILKLANNKPKILDTYLKMNITYRYNKPDMSGLNDIVHFETYKYLIEGRTLNYSLLELSNNDMLSAPSELVIGNRHFTAPETIFAWDKITTGKISSDPGVEVIIQSAGEIVVEPDAEIYSDILLLIDNPSVCNATRIQPTVIDRSFCENKTKYSANTTLAKTGDIAPTPPAQRMNQSVIYPNPTQTGNFTIATKLETDSYIEVAIFDLTGKLIHKQQSAGSLSKGMHKMEFNDLLFEQGMYLVEVETNEGKNRHRLMIK